MPLLLLLAALAVLAAIAVVASGMGTGLGTTSPDRAPGGELPLGDEVDRAALDGLRFSLAFRGYRMDEVDAVIDRLASELEIRDHRIAELEDPAPPAPAAEVRPADVPGEA